MIMGTLFIVATPIGNLEDITLRALRILKEVDLILCEDTRITTKLLRHYKIEKPLLSFYEHNEIKRIPQIIKKLRQNQKIALVADSGTPLISDPGSLLVRTCIEQNIPIVPIPGPNSAITALITSGLNSKRFLFLGFLPKSKKQKQSELRNLFQCIKTLKRKPTIIFFESPQRILESLELIHDILGEVKLAVCFELTKLHERVYRGKISEIERLLTQNSLKGEITVVLKPRRLIN